MSKTTIYLTIVGGILGVAAAVNVYRKVLEHINDLDKRLESLEQFFGDSNESDVLTDTSED